MVSRDLAYAYEDSHKRHKSTKGIQLAIASSKAQKVRAGYNFKAGITTSTLAKPPPIKPSRTARKSVSQPTSIMQPTLQAGAYRAITKALCAVQASRRLRVPFFASFLGKQKEVAEGIKGNPRGFRTKRIKSASNTFVNLCGTQKKMKCQHNLATSEVTIFSFDSQAPIARS